MKILHHNHIHPSFMTCIHHNHRFDAVIHFAGLKAVGESVEKPFLYYNNNIVGSLLLCQTMAKYGCKKVSIHSFFNLYLLVALVHHE